MYRFPEQDYSRVPPAQAHAIKSKATCCIPTSWGSATTAARSPTATTTNKKGGVLGWAPLL
jgi:hypothetical protein